MTEFKLSGVPPRLKEALRQRGTAILRSLNWILSALLATAFAVHTFIPESLAWLTPDFKTAIAIAVFAFLVDRILAIHRAVGTPPIVVFDRREDAYEDLLSLIKQYKAKSVDMLQFSGDTVLGLLKGIAKTRGNVTVRLFLAHPCQAAQFDRDRGDEFHVDRIRHTLEEVKLICEEYSNITVQAFYYKTPAGLSAVLVDDWIMSAGWYHCFQDEESPEFLRVRGHSAPAINSVGQSGNALIRFVSLQIKNLEKHAEKAQ
jgi:hypothetical protein